MSSHFRRLEYLNFSAPLLGLMLALAGGLAGLLFAVWGTGLLVQLAAKQIPRSWEIGLDWRVFAFLVIVCIVTGLGFGLVPALAASGRAVQSSMKESGGRGSEPECGAAGNAARGSVHGGA